MRDIEELRSEVTNTYYDSEDSLTDIAYEAKVSQSTVWSFVHGHTSVPTFLTRWGLEQYVQKRKLENGHARNNSS